jgi:DNA repair exonuclease SbcCD ATPase subunit/RNA polymerase-binding transcription factor DksA
MRLLHLTATNFGPFADPGVDLDLAGQGLVAVVGTNRTDPGFDANGVGKSSILDALMWALFGETGARRETSSNDSGLKGDEVVNERAGKDCVVVVDFARDNGQVVRVRRWRRAKPDADSKRGSGVDVAERVHEGTSVAFVQVANLDKSNVQAAIDSRLGFDRTLFCQTVVRGQEDTFSFAQATPKERFDILTQIEDLSELDAWDERFRARARLLAHELAVLSGATRGKEATITVYREQAVRDADAAERWESDRQGRLGELHRRHGAALGALAEVDARLATKADHGVRLAGVDAALAALQPPAEPADLAAWEQHHRELQAQLGAARGERDRISAKLTRMAAQREGECESCGQAVTGDHLTAHRGQLEADAYAANVKLTTVSSLANDAAAVIRTARQAYEQARAAVQAQRGQLEYERGQLLGALGAARAEEAGRARIVEQLVRLDADVASTASAANPVQAVSADREAVLAGLEAELAAAKAAESGKAAEAGLCEWWTRNIPSLKAWIFDSVVGEITREANRWLSVLTGGLCWVEVTATSTTKAGDVRDKIGLKCLRWNPDGTTTEREYRQWSGGEKRRIALAIDWALAHRLGQRSKGVCTFLALDEVDRHLDAGGRSGLLSAIDILRREKESIIIVSHDPDFRAKPDVTWRVIKQSTGSVVEVSSGRKDQSKA